MDETPGTFRSNTTGSNPDLDYVIGVSWPRSGHHMLVRLLQAYFGDRFGYCDFYTRRPQSIDVAECCCQLPCKNSNRIAFTKSHDFDQDLPIQKGYKYLIQYRDFLPSVISNFELHVLDGGDDTAKNFKIFASEEFTKYQRFLAKWLSSSFEATRLSVNYTHFLQNQNTELARIISYFSPYEEINYNFLTECLKTVDGEKVEEGKITQLSRSGIHQERDVRYFRYYSEELFNDLSRITLDRSRVIEIFWELLRREPFEEDMIHLQAFANEESLVAMVKSSDEYKRFVRNTSGDSY